VTAVQVGLVVEGYGDVKAAPLLVRRIAQEIFGRYDVEVARPFRLARGRMTSQHLAGAARVVAATSPSVLVLLDADDDCARDLASEVRRAADPVAVDVAVAVREFEAWFLSALPSLQGHRAVVDASEFAGDCEAVRDAKGALRERMSENYRETLHQPALVAAMDLQQARQSRSFEHLVSCVGRSIGS
jgi:Domain of unknown function (DUF4276)